MALATRSVGGVRIDVQVDQLGLRRVRTNLMRSGLVANLEIQAQAKVMEKAGVEIIQDSINEFVYSMPETSEYERTYKLFRGVKGQEIMGGLGTKLYIHHSVQNPRDAHYYPPNVEHGVAGTAYFGRHYWQFAMARLRVRFLAESRLTGARIAEAINKGK